MSENVEECSDGITHHEIKGDLPNLADCACVLYHKLWSKTVVRGQLKSEVWWRRRLDILINAPAIDIPKENLWDGKPAEPAPIPYEIEMGLEKGDTNEQVDNNRPGCGDEAVQETKSSQQGKTD